MCFVLFIVNWFEFASQIYVQIIIHFFLLLRLIVTCDWNTAQNNSLNILIFSCLFIVFNTVRSLNSAWMAVWRLVDFHVIVFFIFLRLFGLLMWVFIYTLLCTNHVYACHVSQILFIKNIMRSILFHWNETLDFEVTCTYSCTHKHFTCTCAQCAVTIESKMNAKRKKKIPTMGKKTNSIWAV